MLAALTLPPPIHRARINARRTIVAEKGQVAERIIEATELPGAAHERKLGQDQVRAVPTTQVRLGAVDSLERVAAETYRENHIAIFETFAAYVRENYASSPEPAPAPATPAESAPAADQAASDAAPQGAASAPEDVASAAARIREDAHAVLRVILRRSDAQIAFESEEGAEFRTPGSSARRRRPSSAVHAAPGRRTPLGPAGRAIAGCKPGRGVPAVGVSGGCEP